MEKWSLKIKFITEGVFSRAFTVMSSSNVRKVWCPISVLLILSNCFWWGWDQCLLACELPPSNNMHGLRIATCYDSMKWSSHQTWRIEYFYVRNSYFVLSKQFDRDNCDKCDLNWNWTFMRKLGLNAVEYWIQSFLWQRWKERWTSKCFSRILGFLVTI